MQATVSGVRRSSGTCPGLDVPAQCWLLTPWGQRVGQVPVSFCGLEQCELWHVRPYL